MRCKGITYIDRALPFGLRSVPEIFSAVADAPFLDYVSQRDNFRYSLPVKFPIFAVAKSIEWAENLATELRTCNYPGVPVAAKKVDGSSSCLEFLGMRLNSDAGKICLPQASYNKPVVWLAIGLVVALAPRESCCRWLEPCGTLRR